MKKVKVAVAMGSKSDFSVMKEAAQILDQNGVEVIVEIVSAHRTPGLLEKKSAAWEKAGVRCIIAGAGGAAHLPGMLASFSSLPVIGVPIKTKSMHGLDSLLSIAQMPKGVPVAAVAVNNAHNAGLLALQIVMASEENANLRKKIFAKIKRNKKNLEKAVLKDAAKLKKTGFLKFIG